MPDEWLLRKQARAAIEAGILPVSRSDRTWGGRGMNASCAVCKSPITSDELELEMDHQRNDGEPGVDTFHMHIRCFAAWEFERTKV